MVSRRRAIGAGVKRMRGKALSSPPRNLGASAGWIADKVIDRAYTLARRRIKNKILRLEMYKARGPARRTGARLSSRGNLSQVSSTQQRFLIIEPYWALYVHDGRRALGQNDLKRRKKGARFYVWFRDPQNDPRFRGRYPVRFKDQRRLTKREYRKAVQGNPPGLVRRTRLPALRPNPFFRQLDTIDRVLLKGEMARAFDQVFRDQIVNRPELRQSTVETATVRLQVR